jgi:hypothetical protein
MILSSPRPSSFSLGMIPIASIELRMKTPLILCIEILFHRLIISERREQLKSAADDNFSEFTLGLGL